MGLLRATLRALRQTTARITVRITSRQRAMLQGERDTWSVNCDSQSRPISTAATSPSPLPPPTAPKPL